MPLDQRLTPVGTRTQLHDNAGIGVARPLFRTIPPFIQSPQREDLPVELHGIDLRVTAAQFVG
jgi:hypothetical protein